MHRSRDFRIKRNIIAGVLWTLLMCGGAYIAYNNSISNIGFAPRQPMSFSHVTHAGKFGIKCLFCHYSAERSAYSNIPTSKICMICHLGLKTKQSVVAPLIESYDSLRPLVWERVYRLPDYTRFVHSRHISSQIDCSSCHGQVETMDSVWQVRALTMTWCLDCHRNAQAFVIAPREVSGIFAGTDLDSIGGDADNTSAFVTSSPETEPAYGRWQHKLHPEIITGVAMPQPASRAAENCSSCHY